jgi:hypothetical protein
MPNIPLIDIPNAPQGGNGPVLQPQLQGLPQLRGVDVSGAQADTSGLQRAQSLLSAASSQHQQGARTLARAVEGGRQGPIDASAEMNQWEAVGDVGEALQRSTDEIGKFAHYVAKARDTVALSEGSTMMGETFAEHRERIKREGLPEHQWLPIWQQEVLPELAKRIDGIQASPRGRAQLSMTYSQFAAGTSTQFGAAATQQAMRIAGGKVLTAVKRLFDNGEYEPASELLDLATENGILSKEIADHNRTSLIRQKNTELATALVTKNPRAALDDLTRAGSTGASEFFPDAPPSERARYLAMSRRQIRTLEMDAADVADTRIVAGDFARDEDVDKFAVDNDLSPEVTASLKKSLLVTAPHTALDYARQGSAFSALRTQVARYEPGADPEQKQYAAIQDRLRTSLSGEARALLLGELSTRRKQGATPTDRLRGTAYETVDRLAGQGLFGDSGLDARGQVIAGQEDAALRHAEALSHAKDRVDVLVKLYAEKEPAKFRKEVNDLLEPQVRKHAATRFRRMGTGGGSQGPGNAGGAFNNGRPQGLPPVRSGMPGQTVGNTQGS